MNIALLIATIACLAPLVLFLVGAARVRGWKNEAGRAVMVVSSAGVIAFGLGVLRLLDLLPPEWARIIAYVVVACALWWQYGTFLHVQANGRERERRRIMEREELRQNR